MLKELSLARLSDSLDSVIQTPACDGGHSRACGCGLAGAGVAGVPAPGAPWKIHLQQHRESDRAQRQVTVFALLQPTPTPDFLPWDPFSFECCWPSTLETAETGILSRF